MTDDSATGRLLRGGRVVARLLLVWLLVALALRVADVALDDFAMPEWWQPTVFALLYGVLSAVVWPLVLRFALPVAVFTLGVGSLLILGAGILALSFAVPGIVVANLRTAVLVVLVVTAVGALVSSLLALDEDELFFRRAARRFRRAEDGDGDEPPGVLLLQIDGLGYDTVRRAVRDGDLPTLAAWLAEGSHALTDWHCDWSSQTGASVCGLLHGSNDDILGFRWYEKDRDHVMACAHPADAAEIERRHSDGRGLLAGGGAARSGLFTGDADHTSMTMSAVPLLTPARTGGGRSRNASGYYVYFANPVNLVRTVGAAVVDILREVSASVRQRRAGVRPRVKRGGVYPFARAATTVITRDLVVSSIIGDMLAGRPVVYADFLGYDEVAHHTGIERFDALAVIRAIDQQIGRLHRAAELAPRPYRLVVLSDHGVTQGWAFADRFGESVEELVGRLCGAPPRPGRTKTSKPANTWQLNAALAEASAGAGPIARGLRARAGKTPDHRHRAADGAPAAVTRAAPGVVVVVSGHVAMVSFTEHEGRVDLETIEREFPDLLPALVDHPGVGFTLVRAAESGPVVLGRDGLLVLESGEVRGEDPLTGYGEHAADLIRRTDGFAHCPDLLINSRYSESTDDASPFETHVGSHGGLGGGQSRGFLVYPADLPRPARIVGAEALHRVVRGWLTHLGHPEPRPAPEAVEQVAATPG